MVDDCSTDETHSLLNELNHSKLKSLVTTSNRGPSHARNEGIKMARGKWIAFLDSDDEWTEKKLELQFDFIQKNPHFGIVHTDEIWIRNGVRVNPHKKHQKTGGDIFIRSLELCLISPSAVVIRRDFFEKYGLFDEEMTVCEDYDLWLKITLKEEVGYIDELLIKKYGGHNDQLSTRFKAMDLFRLKSLYNLKKTRREDFTSQKLEALNDVFQKKYSILKNGYLKHERFKELNDIQKIYNSFD